VIPLRLSSAAGLQQFGGGVPEPGFSFRVVGEEFDLPLLASDGEGAVAQISPALV
jgi:hypothetical protein